MKLKPSTTSWIARFILWNVGAALGTVIFTCMFYGVFVLLEEPSFLPVFTFFGVGGYLVLVCTMWAIDVVFVRPNNFKEFDDDVQGY